METNEPIRVVGMPWYAEEDFAEIKTLMEDGDGLARTYVEWRRVAEAGEQQLRSDGCFVVRALIKPHAFRQFCLAHGLRLDAQGRLRFANRVAVEEYRAGGGEDGNRH